MKLYFPIKSDKPKYKYYIITSTGRKVYFGAAGYNDHTIYYHKEGKEKADKMKRAYITRHSKSENWAKSGIDTAGFWSRWLLWNKPTIQASYNDIKKRFL
jgi:hypothetical protein